LVVKRYVPDAGDIVKLDFDPSAGHEQAGRRPALVLSPASYNGKTGLAVLCPITNQAKGYPFEVALPKGLKITGAVLADHLKNQDWEVREAAYEDRVPLEILNAVRNKIAPLLGITP
jgi:mRNA interferase MazF